ERLPGDIGRAVRLAAAALGAGVSVEHLLPGEIRELRAAELGGVLQVELAELTDRGQAPEEDSGQAGDDVEVLAIGEEVAEREDQRDVKPERRVRDAGQDTAR